MIVTLIVGWLGLYTWLLRHSRGSKNSGDQSLTAAPVHLSVVVCARNEEKHMANCLRHLEVATNGAATVQWLLVNDQSADNTAQIMHDFLASRMGHLIETVGDGGKNQGLQKALENAVGDYIYFTDADSLAGKWSVWSLVQLLTASPLADLACGPVSLARRSGILAALVRVESSVNQSISGALITAGTPLMANGANMLLRARALPAYRRSLAAQPSASGDDVFYIQSLRKGQCANGYFGGNAVSTESPSSAFDLWSQRLRWASKAKYYRSPRVLIFGGFVATMALGWVLLTMGALFQIISPYVFWGLWAIKVVFEYVVHRFWLRSFNESLPFYLSAVFTVAHPFYTVAVGLQSFISGSFTWKGRSYTSANRKPRA